MQTLKDQNSTNAMFASILETEGGGGGGDEGGKSQEDVIFEVAQTNLSKIPSLFDMELAKLKYPVRWDNSMNTVSARSYGSTVFQMSSQAV